MTKWILSVLLAGLILLFPVSAAAQTTIIEPAGSQLPYQRWVDESEVPTPTTIIEVVETPAGVGCPSAPKEAVGQYPACTDETDHIWIGAEEIKGVHPRAIFMHEVGHVFDGALMPEWARLRFEEIYDLPGPWFYAEEEWNSPGEWFAEAYAECSVKPYITESEWDGGYAPLIYGGQPIFFRRIAHNKACRLIQTVGA